MTGVQRMASELVRALDDIAGRERHHERWVLLCPPNSRVPPLRHIEVRTVGTDRLGLHVWEQWLLPAYAGSHVLLNLAGPAPLLKRRQVCMIPDAAIYDCPATYRIGFRLFYRAVFRMVSRRALVLLTLSEFSRERLARALGSRLDAATVTYAGSEHLLACNDDLAFLDRHRLRGTQFLLAVASQTPGKNIARLVSAFEHIADPNTQLVLVGGMRPQVFSSTRTDRDSRHNIISLGAVSDPQLATLYRHATAFVMPSLYEGLGLPPLEAMAMGCPVAAARAAALPEVCGDGALYFDPTSVADIARSLTSLITDATLRADLRRRGRQTAARYSWPLTARRVLDAIDARVL